MDGERGPGTLRWTENGDLAALRWTENGDLAALRWTENVYLAALKWTENGDLAALKKTEKEDLTSVRWTGKLTGPGSSQVDRDRGHDSRQVDRGRRTALRWTEKLTGPRSPKVAGSICERSWRFRLNVVMAERRRRRVSLKYHSLACIMIDHAFPSSTRRCGRYLLRDVMRCSERSCHWTRRKFSALDPRATRTH